jgi:hypothetical protein
MAATDDLMLVRGMNRTRRANLRKVGITSCGPWKWSWAKMACGIPLFGCPSS